MTCRSCQSAGDSELFSDAKAILQRIHAKGVIHGDLRERNFVVMEQGSKRSIWLLDFSHCHFSSATNDQESELFELDDLFFYFSERSTDGSTGNITNA